MALQDSKAFKVGAIVVAVLILGGGVWIGLSQAGGSKVNTAERIMICSETLQSFSYEAGPDETAPFPSPHSGQMTGWPAEKCYWTKDGKAKLEPTYVLLNEYIGKSGPTLCPDCGRRVVRHNPKPPDELLLEAQEEAGN
jgi:hypothetical protein